MAKQGKRVIGKLKASEIANAKPGRYEDGGGLRLVVRKNGSMYWEFRFTWNGNPVSMGLGGIDPSLKESLGEARDKAHQCRKLLREGKDPRATGETERRAKAAEATFREDAEDYIDHKKDGWGAPYKRNRERLLEKHVYHVMLKNGQCVQDVLSKELDTPQVLEILLNQKLWGKKNPTAQNVRRLIEEIMDFSKFKDHRTGENPARWHNHLESALPKPGEVHKTKHHAALHFSKAPAYLADLRTETSIAAPALEFDIHVVIRIEVAVSAEWDEFGPKETPEGVEFPEMKWSIAEERMKGYKKIDFPDRKYVVPLTEPMVKILKRQWKIRESKYVFPGRKLGHHVHKYTVLKLAKRLTADEVTTHGFRATFETWADDRTICDDWVKEMSLAHSVGNDTEKAYRRSDLFDKRRLLMEAWSEYLDTARDLAVDINERFMRRLNGGSQVDAAPPVVASAEPTVNGGVDPRLLRIAIIDLEASSLGSGSFPTEIGWAMFREDGSIESGSCLIQPTAKWLRYRNAWNPAAERLTGITKEMLDRDGVSPSEAISRFWAAVEDRDIFSDAAEFDYHWFCMLAREGGFDFGEDDDAGDFFGDLTRLMDEMSLTVAFGDMPRHRAEADARRLLMGLRSRDTLSGLGRAA